MIKRLAMIKPPAPAMKLSAPPTSGANAANAAAEAAAGAAAADVTVEKIRAMAPARINHRAQVRSVLSPARNLVPQRLPPHRRLPPMSARKSVRHLNRLVSSQP